MVGLRDGKGEEMTRIGRRRWMPELDDVEHRDGDDECVRMVRGSIPAALDHFMGLAKKKMAEEEEAQ